MGLQEQLQSWEVILLEFFEIKESKNKKKSERFSIIDNHKGYEDGEADISLICRLFRVEMDKAVDMVISHKGEVGTRNGVAYFADKESAYKFMFFLEKKTKSLSVSGRVRYERF